MTLNLCKALRLDRGTRLALVGAGGKTTALNLLANELPRPNFVTTSTHIGINQIKIATRHVKFNEQNIFNKIELESDDILLFTGEKDETDRLGGLDDVALNKMYKFVNENNIPVVIEADGSRRLPVKAPAEYEPNIPSWVNYVVYVVGLSCLEKPFSSEVVHRYEQFAKLTGLQPGYPISIDALERLISHPLGGRKNIPENARKIILLNQADTEELQTKANLLAQRLINIFDGIIIASLNPCNLIDEKTNKLPNEIIYNVIEPTTGIILAAGESRRFGEPKILLKWNGETFIRNVIKNALQALLSPIIVVLGSVVENVIDEIKDLPVRIVINPEWKEGQSSSLRAGLNDIPNKTGSVIFLLADQPHLSVELISSLVNLHNKTLAPLIVPKVDEMRANPVLFDKVVFNDLKRVKGDMGGRALFENYPITWLPWEDKRILLDVDTPEDYQTLIAKSKQ